MKTKPKKHGPRTIKLKLGPLINPADMEPRGAADDQARRPLGLKPGNLDETKDMQIRELTARLAIARHLLDTEKREHEKTAQLAKDTLAEMVALKKQLHDGKIWNKENPRWTPRTQAALALAEKEAQAQGATFVDTSHVLLGLLKQQEGIAHRHFVACGMSYEKAEYAMRVGRCS